MYVTGEALLVYISCYSGIGIPKLMSPILQMFVRLFVVAAREKRLPLAPECGTLCVRFRSLQTLVGWPFGMYQAQYFGHKQSKTRQGCPTKRLQGRTKKVIGNLHGL